MASKAKQNHENILKYLLINTLLQFLKASK